MTISLREFISDVDVIGHSATPVPLVTVLQIFIVLCSQYRHDVLM